MCLSDELDMEYMVHYIISESIAWVPYTCPDILDAKAYDWKAIFPRSKLFFVETLQIFLPYLNHQNFVHIKI